MSEECEYKTIVCMYVSMHVYTLYNKLCINNIKCICILLYIFKIAGFLTVKYVDFGSIFIATFDVCSVGIGSHVSPLPILLVRVSLRICDIILR